MHTHAHTHTENISSMLAVVVSLSDSRGTCGGIPHVGLYRFIACSRSRLELAGNAWIPQGLSSHTCGKLAT